MDARKPGKALAAIATIQPELEKFFTDVRVMVDDRELKRARLALLHDLEHAYFRNWRHFLRSTQANVTTEND